MVTLSMLWMPIVAAAILVFAVSSVIHMVLGYHKADYKRLPKEDQRLDALRGDDLAPGYYHFPYCENPKEMGSPEMQAKLHRGPVGMLTVVPNGPMSLGKYLGQWFVFLLVVSFFVAYIAAHTVAAGAGYLAVFRVVGATAFLAYGLGRIVDSVWMGVPWSNTVRNLIDGLIYALMTAGTFGWLWPR